MTSPPLEHPALTILDLCKRGQRRMSAGIMRTSGATAVETKRRSEEESPPGYWREVSCSHP